MVVFRMYRTFFVFLKCTIQGGPKVDLLLIAHLHLWLKFWEGIDKYWIVLVRKLFYFHHWSGVKRLLKPGLGSGVHFIFGSTRSSIFRQWVRDVIVKVQKLLNIGCIDGGRILNKIRILKLKKNSAPDSHSKILEQDRSRGLKMRLRPPLLHTHKCNSWHSWRWRLMAHSTQPFCRLCVTKMSCLYWSIA